MASPSQAESAEAVLHGYLDARAAGEWNRACSYQARVVRRLLNRIDDRGTGTKGRGCAGFLAASTEELSDSELAELADADVSSVRVEGERGYVLYEDGAGAERALAIKLEAGKWRVLGISGPSLTDRAAARDGDS